MHYFNTDIVYAFLGKKLPMPILNFDIPTAVPLLVPKSTRSESEVSPTLSADRVTTVSCSYTVYLDGLNCTREVAGSSGRRGNAMVERENIQVQ